MSGSFPTDMTKVCMPKVRSDGDTSKGSEWCGFLQEGQRSIKAKKFEIQKTQVILQWDTAKGGGVVGKVTV